MVASLIVCAFAMQTPTPEKAQAVYNALQLKLSHSKTLYLTVCPTTGNAWDHEIAFGFRRPNQAFASGMGVRRRTDGKRTSTNDDPQNINRPAKPGDLETFAIVGFESFAKPHAKVVGIGDVRERRVRGRDLLLLDLTIDRRRITLFVDPQTRLPSGYGEAEATEPSMAYGDVTLDKAMGPEYFKVAAPMPARTVYRRSQSAVAKFSSVDVQRWTARHFAAKGSHVEWWVSYKPSDSIAAIKGGPYRRSGRGVEVMQNGGRIYWKLGNVPERWTKAAKGRPPEPVPGFEAFFDPQHPAKVHGVSQIVDFCIGECYAVEARCAGRATTIFIDAESFMPRGYRWKMKGAEEAFYYGQVAPLPPQMPEAYFDPPPRGARASSRASD